MSESQWQDITPKAVCVFFESELPKDTNFFGTYGLLTSLSAAQNQTTGEIFLVEITGGNNIADAFGPFTPGELETIEVQQILGRGTSNLAINDGWWKHQYKLYTQSRRF